MDVSPGLSADDRAKLALGLMTALGAIYTGFRGYRNSVALAELNAELGRSRDERSAKLAQRIQVELDKNRADLERERSELSAKRDYEYEARKRLYKECEPLFFQLRELSADTLHRIQGIASMARKKNLNAEGGWLHLPGYYLISTMYVILAPLVIYKLIQRKLTMVDMTVDAGTRVKFLLLKILYRALSDHHRLATSEPGLTYDPHVSDWRVRREKEPAVFWQQGVAWHRIDMAVESMITGGDGAERCQSFGEFSRAFKKDGAFTCPEAFEPVLDIITGFHPGTRPVLWRILLAQAQIIQQLQQALGGRDVKTIADFPEGFAERFDWGGDAETAKAEWAAVSRYVVKVHQESLAEYAQR